jgi:hypothetical protein
MLDPDFDFYIHVDAKLPLESHDLIASLPNVYLIKNRIKVNWAGYSTIQAELNVIKEVLDTNRDYDFYTLMSGQDYPIATVDEMKAFYKARKGKLLLKYRDFQNEWPEGMQRISKYYMDNFSFPGRYIVGYLLNYLLPKRKLPKSIRFYGSSMFWILSKESLIYVLDKINRNNSIKQFYRYSWAPDEFFFQTMILNSKFADQVLNENGHFYKHLPNTPHPKWLEMNDVDEILKSDRIFARKFNLSKDASVLNLIDAHLDKKNQN